MADFAPSRRPTGMAFRPGICARADAALATIAVNAAGGTHLHYSPQGRSPRAITVDGLDLFLGSASRA